MRNAYWPLFDLRLRVGDIELRPITDADLEPLAEMLPGDVELHPERPRYGLATDGGTWIHQSHWRDVGNWRPESWGLGFCVFDRGQLVGVQGLEGDEFARRRTVDSASWLVPAARGRGVGTAMRLAVLALAFDGLGAQLAVSEAWHDNHASLAVSRALGYVDNGWYLHDREPAGVDRMVRVRLTRQDWALRPAHGVAIENLRPCLPYFGVTD